MSLVVRGWVAAAVFASLAAACGSSSSPDEAPDSGAADATADVSATSPDAALHDAATSDAAVADATTHDDAAAPDAAVDLDAGYPATHAAPPQVITYGGPTLSAPNVVPIFFENDPMQAQIEQFLTSLAASTYWGATTAEYGVGALTIAPSIVVGDAIPPTFTDDQIQGWLASYLDGTHAEWPAIAPNNVYMVFFQSGTQISYDIGTQVETQCTDFGGYHAEWAAGGFDAGSTPFSYAVLPRCAMFGALSGIDAVTYATSHETVEAATDPLPYTNPAYDGVDSDHLIWDFTPLPEVGDMCAYEAQSAQRLVGSFEVQRIWSNRAALAGGDPCVPPLTNAVYYNAAPDLTATVDVTDQGGMYPTLGVKIPTGESATVNIRFFSSGPTTPWTVYLTDSQALFGGPPLLSFSNAMITGNNGDVVPVTVTADATSSLGGVEMVLESYRPGDETSNNFWYGFVQE